MQHKYKKKKVVKKGGGLSSGFGEHAASDAI